MVKAHTVVHMTKVFLELQCAGFLKIFAESAHDLVISYFSGYSLSVVWQWETHDEMNAVSWTTPQLRYLKINLYLMGVGERQIF